MHTFYSSQTPSSSLSVSPEEGCFYARASPSHPSSRYSDSRVVSTFVNEGLLYCIHETRGERGGTRVEVEYVRCNIQIIKDNFVSSRLIQPKLCLFICFTQIIFEMSLVVLLRLSGCSEMENDMHALAHTAEGLSLHCKQQTIAVTYIACYIEQLFCPEKATTIKAYRLYKYG